MYVMTRLKTCSDIATDTKPSSSLAVGLAISDRLISDKSPTAHVANTSP